MLAEPTQAETIAGIQPNLGGARVTAPDAFLDMLAECGSGYHVFDLLAAKVVRMRKTRMVTSCAA